MTIPSGRQIYDDCEAAALALASATHAPRIIGFEEVAGILRDSKFVRPLPPAAGSEFSQNVLKDWSVFQTGPEHQQMRTLVTRALHRLISHFVNTIVDEKIANVVSSAITSKEIEVCSQISLPVVHTLISAVTGISAECLPTLQRASDTLELFGIDHREHEVDAAVAALSAAATNSVLTKIIIEEATRSNAPFGRDFLLHNATMTVFAFFGPLPAAINNLVLSLIGAERWITPETDLVNSWVFESMRLYSPTVAIDRIATSDYDRDMIARGQVVRCDIAAAHRDPAVFQRPTIFDPERNKSKGLLAFGQGDHACVGLSLSRRLSSSILMRVLETTRRVELTRRRIDWHSRINAFGPKTLHVSFVPR